MAVFKEQTRRREHISLNFERSVQYLNNLMVVVCDFTDGPALHPDPPHSHPHEQITYVAEGELYLFLDGEKHHLATGDLFTVLPGVPHCIQIISSKVRLIDSFSPVREDFIN